jgi:hypothetical protein
MGQCCGTPSPFPFPFPWSHFGMRGRRGGTSTSEPSMSSMGLMALPRSRETGTPCSQHPTPRAVIRRSPSWPAFESRAGQLWLGRFDCISASWPVRVAVQTLHRVRRSSWDEVPLDVQRFRQVNDFLAS